MAKRFQGLAQWTIPLVTHYSALSRFSLLPRQLPVADHTPKSDKDPIPRVVGNTNVAGRIGQYGLAGYRLAQIMEHDVLLQVLQYVWAIPESFVRILSLVSIASLNEYSPTPAESAAAAALGHRRPSRRG